MQCVTKTIKSDEDEAVVLLASRKKKLKKRRASLSKSNNNTTNKLEDTLKNKLEEDSDEDDYDGDNELDETDNSLLTSHPKIKPIWINLVGSSILIGLTLGSCYASMIMTTQLSSADIDGDDSSSSTRLIPQILGWLSAVLYVGSRLPQIIKNWRQQSTDGLSSGMFICAVIGNAFFTLVNITISKRVSHSSELTFFYIHSLYF
jgi:uncharacterized protein with PQ loop repeat